MKSTTFILVTYVFFAMNAYGQLKIISDGSVGINESTPEKQLHIFDNNDEIQLLLENTYIAGDHAKSGAGIKFKNGNNYSYYLINESNNYWGHTNTLDFRDNTGHIQMQLFPDQSVGINGLLGVDYTIRLHSHQTGHNYGASGFDFNTATSYEGMILEQRSGGESSGFYSDGDYAVIWSAGDQNRLLRVYDEDGMVEKWHIDGAGYAHTNSDLNKKENIQHIENTSNQLLKINGVKYNFKKEENLIVNTDVLQINPVNNADSIYPGDIEYSDNNKYDPSGKNYYGFIAQEVELIYPELVSTNEKGEKFVSYMEFIPILVEAIKEQQKVIDKQDVESAKLLERIAKLENEVQMIKTNCCNSAKPVLKSGEMEEFNNSTQTQEPELFQNNPNPFSETTKIKYYLPETISNAMICIYDMNGKQLKCYNIEGDGTGIIIIDGNELQAGMYMYSLIAGGKVVDTKRMVLTN